MKTFKYVLQLVLLSFVVMTTSCSRSYDEPPLHEPQYTPKGSKITIAALKDRYKDVGEQPQLIDTEFYLQADVVANDISGNIFKQLYIQDATGGINMGVDQNNVSGEYGVGQEVFVQLHGMYILKYGGEFQVGWAGTQANRVPWEIFKEHVKRNGFAKPANAIPTPLDLGKLYNSATPVDELNKLVNTLVVLNNVHFIEGGKANFINPEINTTERVIKDAKGNTVTLRTSKFATPFNNKVLPKGNGKITGILGRHNGNWQFIVRDLFDVKDTDFDGGEPNVEEPGETGNLFYETFGDGFYPSGNRPKINDFKDGLMKAPIKYTDPTGAADIRSMTGPNVAHVWLPSNKESSFVIEGIKTTGHSNLVLTYELCANLYNAGEATDLNVIDVKINGVAMTIPSKPVSNANGDNNKFYPITIDNFPIADEVKVEFISTAAKNTLGMRLDNIKIGPKDNTITPNPAP